MENDGSTESDNEEERGSPCNKRHRDVGALESPAELPPSKRPRIALNVDTEVPTSHRHAKRRLKRAATRLTNPSPSHRTLEKIVQVASPIPTSMETEALPAAKGAYSAINEDYDGAKRLRTVSELVEKKGFTYIPWDGR